MNQITPDTKVSEIIRRCPTTVNVFLNRGCPDMRRGFFSFMARLMSVRHAARIHKIELASLLDELNRVAQQSKRQDP
jgi:hypothetical protein